MSDMDKYVSDSGKQCIEHCPFEKMRPKLILTGNAVLSLRYLQDKFDNVEFTVYGNTTKIDNLVYTLEDIVVPEQIAAPAQVDDIILTSRYNTVIHKHPGRGGVGFSHSDEETVNQNHDFSVIIGGDDKKLNHATGVACIKIDCGRYMKSLIDIEVIIPKTKDTDFIKSTKNIKVRLDGSQNIISNIRGFIGSNKQPQQLCRKCKVPLEKTENEKEWECKKCDIIYVQR